MESESKTYVLQLTLGQFQALHAGVHASIASDTDDGLPLSEDLESGAYELSRARPRTLEELADYGQDRLREDYFSDVRSIAEELLSEALSEEQDEDRAREEVEERLWESVDSSAWVIYTARAMDVLRISENDSYSVDNFGTEGIVSDCGIEWSKLAFGAMYADVSEKAWELFEAWEEDRDSFKEDIPCGFCLESFELRDVGSRILSADGWEDGPADRYTLTIETPDGESLSWTMSAEATICQSTDGPGAGSLVSIVSPDIPDAVRAQALVLVDWIRDETGRELAEARTKLAEARTELDERSELYSTPLLVRLSDRIAETAEEVDRLEEQARELGVDVEKEEK